MAPGHPVRGRAWLHRRAETAEGILPVRIELRRDAAGIGQAFRRNRALFIPDRDKTSLDERRESRGCFVDKIRIEPGAAVT